LASKRLNTKAVLDIVLKIVNTIREKSRQRRLFDLTLEEGAPDFILRSRYNFLQRFRSFLSEINDFLEGEGRREKGIGRWGVII
jgi:hypothetical protein